MCFSPIDDNFLFRARHKGVLLKLFVKNKMYLYKIYVTKYDNKYILCKFYVNIYFYNLLKI